METQSKAYTRLEDVLINDRGEVTKTSKNKPK